MSLKLSSLFCGACVVRTDRVYWLFLQMQEGRGLGTFNSREAYKQLLREEIFHKQHANIILTSFFMLHLDHIHQYLLCAWHSWPVHQISFLVFMADALNLCIYLSFLFSCFFLIDSSVLANLSFSPPLLYLLRLSHVKIWWWYDFIWGKNQVGLFLILFDLCRWIIHI